MTFGVNPIRLLFRLLPEVPQHLEKALKVLENKEAQTIEELIRMVTDPDTFELKSPLTEPHPEVPVSDVADVVASTEEQPPRQSFCGRIANCLFEKFVIPRLPKKMKLLLGIGP
jgi:hypothetical protein